MKPNGKVQRQAPPSITARIVLRPADDQGCNDFPHLCEALYPLYDREGRLAREGGSVSIRVDGSLYRVSVTLPSEQAATGFATDTLIGIVEQIERHLATTRDWVTDYKSKRQARNRLKRS